MFDNNWLLFVGVCAVFFCVHYLQKINEGLKSIHYLNNEQLKKLNQIKDSLDAVSSNTERMVDVLDLIYYEITNHITNNEYKE